VREIGGDSHHSALSAALQERERSAGDFCVCLRMKYDWNFDLSGETRYEQSEKIQTRETGESSVFHGEKIN